MNTEHEHSVVDAMERYGGGFVQALAVCFRKADDANFEKLRRAFPEYWDQYEYHAMQAKAAQAAIGLAHIHSARDHGGRK